jgi:hypothetical protein
MRAKLPPRIKVLEALGTIADNRVKMIEKGIYTVTSSEHDREYKVLIRGREVCSNDNGTRFRRYVGYPIIASLMLERIVSYDERIANSLKGIKWRKLNEELRDYNLVEEEVYKIAEERGVKREELSRFIERVMRELKGLSLELNLNCIT